jgi:hypothetical protein
MVENKVRVVISDKEVIDRIKSACVRADAPSGMKFDGGKPRFSLLRFGCARALRGVAKVLTFGAQKYAAHSWREVPEGVDRYWSALERHLNEIGTHGLDSRDEESGLLHIDHVGCNVMFLSELIRTQHGIDE